MFVQQQMRNNNIAKGKESEVGGTQKTQSTKERDTIEDRGNSDADSVILSEEDSAHLPVVSKMLPGMHAESPSLVPCTVEFQDSALGPSSEMNASIISISQRTSTDSLSTCESLDQDDSGVDLASASLFSSQGSSYFLDNCQNNGPLVSKSQKVFPQITDPLSLMKCMSYPPCVTSDGHLPSRTSFTNFQTPPEKDGASRETSQSIASTNKTTKMEGDIKEDKKDSCLQEKFEGAWASNKRNEFAQQDTNDPTKNAFKKSMSMPLSPSASRSATEAYRDICMLCFSRQKEAILIHGKTGHQVCCYPCAKRLRRRRKPCPVCRRPISKVVRNFLV